MHVIINSSKSVLSFINRHMETFYMSHYSGQAWAPAGFFPGVGKFIGVGFSLGCAVYFPQKS